MSQPFNRPPTFYRPPRNDSNFGGRMPWGSPRLPMRQQRPPYLRPPFGMSHEGFRLPSHMQAPPMFGPGGATVPPHLMKGQNHRGKGPRNNQRQDFINNGDSAKEFWCEACDRGFNTKDMLDKHNSEHQKCGIDGCEFTAHAGVVTKHIQMQHRTGLYDKIRNINTPEDIQNWIAERKKKYPTKENIEKQKAQEKECFDRGEKLQDDKSRFNNNRGNRGNNRGNNTRGGNRGRGNNRGGGKFQDRRNNFNGKKDGETNNVNIDLITETVPSTSVNNQFDKKTVFTKTPGKEVTKREFKKPKWLQEPAKCAVEGTYRNLHPFKGTSELVRNDLICNDQVVPVTDDLDIEDNEWQQQDAKSSETQKLAVCSALSNLISAYNSSDDDQPDKVSCKRNESSSNINFKNNASNDAPKLSVETKATPDSISPVKSIIYDHLKSIDICSKEVDPQETSVEIDKDIGSDGSEPEEVKIEKVQEEFQIPNELDNIIENSTNKRVRKRKHSSNVASDGDTLAKKPNCNAVVKDKVAKEKNGPSNQQQFRRRVPKTLLEKLLEKDIRNERNLVLQCAHFIVQNNFFHKPTHEPNVETMKE